MLNEENIQQFVLRVIEREKRLDEIEVLLTKLLRSTKLEPLTWPTYYVNLSQRSWS